MYYQVEALDEYRHRITVELDAAEVDTGFARTYVNCACRYPFDGYQQGKVPAQAIDAAFGTDAVASITGETLRSEAFGRAVGEADLVTIGQPAYPNAQAPERGQSYSFVAEVDCSPIFELSSYEPITVRLPKVDKFNPGLARSAARMRETEALHALAQRLQGEPPEILCDAQEEEELQAIYAKANAANLPFEAYLVQQRIDPTHFRREIEEQALETVKRNLALDSWAAHKGFAATDEQISEGFANSELEHPAYEQAEWRATGRIAQVRQNIRRAAAMRDIMNTLIVETIE